MLLKGLQTTILNMIKQNRSSDYGSDKQNATESDPKDRIFVIKEVLKGLILTLIVCPLGLYLMPVTVAKLDTVCARFLYTLRWQGFSVLTLIFGIIKVAIARFMSVANNPISGKGEHIIATDVRYLQNTLEQLVVSATGQLMLSTYLEESLQRVVPTLVFCFVLGRILFYIGYVREPLKRATGMAITALPSVVVHVYCFYFFITAGPLHGLK